MIVTLSMVKVLKLIMTMVVTLSMVTRGAGKSSATAEASQSCSKAAAAIADSATAEASHSCSKAMVMVMVLKLLQTLLLEAVYQLLLLQKLLFLQKLLLQPL